MSDVTFVPFYVLCFIEFVISATAPSIHEMWLVLGFNRLTYRKNVDCCFMELQLSGKCVPEYEIVIIILDRQPCWISRHLGITAMLVSAILDLDTIFVLIIIVCEFTLMLTHSW